MTEHLRGKFVQEFVSEIVRQSGASASSERPSRSEVPRDRRRKSGERSLQRGRRSRGVHFSFLWCSAASGGEGGGQTTRFLRHHPLSCHYPLFPRRSLYPNFLKSVNSDLKQKRPAGTAFTRLPSHPRVTSRHYENKQEVDPWTRRAGLSLIF